MGVMSRIGGAKLWIALGVLALLSWLGTFAIEGLRRDPRFFATPELMKGSGPGWAGSPVMKPVVDRLKKLGPINLFDPDFASKIENALYEVPGLASVESVRRIWPRRYGVSFTMHQPAAVVYHEDRRIPVTADGIVLPGEPYAGSVKGLLRIRGVHAQPPKPGRRWRCESLADGLATIDQLEPHRVAIAPLGIEWVDVSGAFQSRLGVVLYGAEKTRVRWGRPRSEVGENSVKIKIELLMGAVRRLDRAMGRELDVRFDEVFADS